jgi:thiosulfate/3-mercaptopyruvate sulfurtransferase
MPSVLIDAAELAAALAGPTPPVVLDVRWKLGGPPGDEEYRRGHIPGAVYAGLDTQLAAPRTPGTGRHPLPTPEAWQATLRSWGVRDGGAVVAYDDAGSTSAARAWWMLRWAGIDDARVLDGGLAAWRDAGHPLSTDMPEPAEGDVVVRPGAMRTLTADEAARLAGDGVLLDARAGERFRGEVEPIDPVAGHIPHARSAPTTDNVDGAGRFLPPDALRDRFARLGVEPGVPVGAYCGSGVSAAHEVLALAIAGVDAALYPGSWSEWIADRSRPVATGE